MALPTSAQTLPQEFVDWTNRFDRDMHIAAAIGVGETPAFALSLWPAGSASKYLYEMHTAGQLFPKPRNRGVWSLGQAFSFLTKANQFAGSGGTVVGADLNGNLPREALEVIYLRPPADPGNRLESALKRRFGVDQLRVPRVGILRRNEYPFLLFKRIDGKLYLAAFSKEFMAMVDAVFTLQIAGSDRRSFELANATLQ
jgi:hypothetical protein